MEAKQRSKRVIRPDEASSAYGIGKTKLYALIKQRRIESVKVDGLRLIFVDSLETLIGK